MAMHYPSASEIQALTGLNTALATEVVQRATSKSAERRYFPLKFGLLFIRIGLAVVIYLVLARLLDHATEAMNPMSDALFIAPASDVHMLSVFVTALALPLWGVALLMLRFPQLDAEMTASSLYHAAAMASQHNSEFPSPISIVPALALSLEKRRLRRRGAIDTDSFEDYCRQQTRSFSRKAMMVTLSCLVLGAVTFVAEMSLFTAVSRSGISTRSLGSLEVRHVGWEAVTRVDTSCYGKVASRDASLGYKLILVDGRRLNLVEFHPIGDFLGGIEALDAIFRERGILVGVAGYAEWVRTHEIEPEVNGGCRGELERRFGDHSRTIENLFRLSLYRAP